MPKCPNCDTKISWKDITFSIWKGFKPIKCGKCKKENCLDILSRIIWPAFTLFPIGFFIFLFLNLKIIEKSGIRITLAIVTSVVWLIFSQLVLPYLISINECQTNNEDDKNKKNDNSSSKKDKQNKEKPNKEKPKEKGKIKGSKYK